MGTWTVGNTRMAVDGNDVRLQRTYCNKGFAKRVTQSQSLPQTLRAGAEGTEEDRSPILAPVSSPPCRCTDKV